LERRRQAGFAAVRRAAEAVGCSRRHQMTGGARLTTAMVDRRTTPCTGWLAPSRAWLVTAGSHDARQQGQARARTTRR